MLFPYAFRLDMCRRQYANDACNRGTAGRRGPKFSFKSEHATVSFTNVPHTNVLTTFIRQTLYKLKFHFFTEMKLLLLFETKSIYPTRINIYKIILMFLLDFTL